jgi:hypothetical protein
LVYTDTDLLREKTLFLLAENTAKVVLKNRGRMHANNAVTTMCTKLEEKEEMRSQTQGMEMEFQITSYVVISHNQGQWFSNLNDKTFPT